MRRTLAAAALAGLALAACNDSPTPSRLVNPLVLAGLQSEGLTFNFASGSQVVLGFDQFSCRDDGQACSASFTLAEGEPTGTCDLDGGRLSCDLVHPSGATGRIDAALGGDFTAHLEGPSGTLDVAGTVSEGTSQGTFSFQGSSSCPCQASGDYQATFPR